MTVVGPNLNYSKALRALIGNDDAPAPADIKIESLSALTASWREVGKDLRDCVGTDEYPDIDPKNMALVTAMLDSSVQMASRQLLSLMLVVQQLNSTKDESEPEKEVNDILPDADNPSVREIQRLLFDRLTDAAIQGVVNMVLASDA